MPISITWKTPREVEWNSEYRIEFEIGSTEDITACRVYPYEDGEDMDPSPINVGEMAKDESLPVLLNARAKKDWKFYKKIIGIPFGTTKKTFEYYVKGSARGSGGKVDFGDDPKCRIQVTVSVPDGKKREGRLAFTSLLLGAGTVLLAVVAPAFAVIAAGANYLRESVYDGMKDPPEFDEDYREVMEPTFRTLPDLGLAETDASNPAGQFAIALDRLNSTLRAFYITEARGYSALRSGDRDNLARQTNHLKILRNSAGEEIRRVVEYERSFSTQVSESGWTYRTENRLQIIEDWLSRLKLWPDDSSAVREATETIAGYLNKYDTYGNVVRVFVGDLEGLRGAMDWRLASLDKSEPATGTTEVQTFA